MASSNNNEFENDCQVLLGKDGAILFLCSQTVKQVQVGDKGRPGVFVVVVSNAKLGTSFGNDWLDFVEMSTHDIREKMVGRLMV